MKQLSFFMTSDTHGHWLGRQNDDHHGLLNTATALQELRARLGHTSLAIDLGDFIQGSSFATYCAQISGDGSCFAQAMNTLDYDYQIIGNHEFNFGQDYRDAILNQLHAPILAANIVKKGSQTPFMGKAYDIRQVDGIKVGIIGITTHYIPNWELPKHYEGIEFLDAFETAKKYVQELRPQVDVVVLAYHGGFEADLDTGQLLEADKGENQGYRMVKEIPGIDVLLTGHQHRLLNQQVGNTYIVQPGHGGERIAQVTLTLDDDHQITGLVGYLHEVDDYVADKQLATVMEPSLSQGKAWLSTVLGTAPLQQPTQDIFLARLNGHPFIELLNQVQLKVTGAEFSGIALVNEYFSSFHGPITNEILLKAYPYYNLIATVQLTGRQLYQVMEFDFHYFEKDEHGQIIVNPTYVLPKPKHYNYDLYSGFTTYVDMNQPTGKRIKTIIDERTGQAIEMDRLYRVAVSQYRAVGGGDYDMFGQDKILAISETDIATALIEALNEFEPEKWDQINHDYQHVRWVD